MPSVNLQPQTYEAIERIAEATGRGVEETVQEAVERYLLSADLSEEELVRQFDEALAAIWTKVPKDIPPEEIDADIDAAIDEIWAERRAERRASRS